MILIISLGEMHLKIYALIASTGQMSIASLMHFAFGSLTSAFMSSFILNPSGQVASHEPQPMHASLSIVTMRCLIWEGL